MRIAISVAFLAFVALPPTADAQACSGGRERVDGHCCWPEQTWSRAERVCEGAPRCPSGMDEEGEGCVPSAVPTAQVVSGTTPTSVLSPVAPRPPTVLGGATSSSTAISVVDWPSLPGPPPGAVVDPIVHRGMDDGLIFGGLITFGVGYLLGVAVGLADLASQNCHYTGSNDPFFPEEPAFDLGCESGAFGFVPFAGGLLSGTMVLADNPGSHGYARVLRREYVLGAAGGGLAGAAQLVGLWIFLHGIAGYTLDVFPAADLGPTASLRLAPDAPGADAGLSMTLDF